MNLTRSERRAWMSYILPLLFFKRISDVWDEECVEIDEGWKLELGELRKPLLVLDRTPPKPVALGEKGVANLTQGTSYSSRI